MDRHDRSKGLRAFTALTWVLGLSLRSVSHVLAMLGCELSRMSVWRDVHESGSNALSGLRRAAPGSVRVMGADETFVKLRGEKVAVGLPLAAAGVVITAANDYSREIAFIGQIPNTLATIPASLGIHEPHHHMEQPGR